jgi:hypothetical protein
MIEDLNYIDNNYLRRKYTPFRAWKWYSFLFQLTYTSEVLITVYFWAVLYNP